MIAFLVESLVLIVLFTLAIVPSCLKEPLNHIQDYPEPIRERVKELGLPVREESRKSKAFLIRKGIALVLALAILTVILVFINKAQTFLQGFLISYGLWMVVNWYDAIVLDIAWFCHDKRVVIPGTEDLTDAYHDYWFHIKKSLFGSLLGLPVCALVGLLVMLVNHIC